MIYLQMFWEFFKTGLFAIGGGLATLPFLSKIGNTYGWFTQEELANMLAVSESTPGPIGVNMATYVGNTVAGFWGGIVATFSLVLPSYIIIYTVAKVMEKFQGNRYVQGAMTTLRPASVGMIGAAVLDVLVSVLFHTEAIAAQQWTQLVAVPNLILFILLLGFYHKFQKLHPVVILAIGAAAGILLKL